MAATPIYELAFFATGQNPTGSVDTPDKRKPGQSQSDEEPFKDVSKKDPCRQQGGQRQEQEDEKRRAS